MKGDTASAIVSSMGMRLGKAPAAILSALLAFGRVAWAQEDLPEDPPELPTEPEAPVRGKTDRPVKEPKALVYEEDSSEVTVFTMTQEELGERSHRVLYVASGAMLVGGLILGLIAKANVDGLESLDSARLMQDSLEGARTAAATANLLYGLSVLTLGWGLFLEGVPEAPVENPPLLFHF